MLHYNLAQSLITRTRLAALASTLLLPMAVSAAPNSIPSGTNIGFGHASDTTTIFNVVANPAMAAYASKKEDNSFTGIGTNLFSIYGGIEFGAVDNLADKFDELENSLDTNNTQNNTQDANVALIDSTNAILAEIGDNGYFQGGFVFHLPLTPFTIESFGGTLAFDINISDFFYTRLLDSPLTLNPLTGTPESASSLYIKNAKMTEFSLSYSRFITETLGGDLYLGFRTKILNGDFGKTVLKFDSIGDDVGDEIIDSLSGDSSVQSTQFGIDIGIIYALDSITLGATFLNLNTPEFSYQTLGENCSQGSATEKSSCEAAALFGDRINLKETHIMDSQVKLDAAWQPVNWWKVSMSYDVNAVNDVIGNPFQNMFIGTSINSRSFFIPSLRLGYNQNLVGSKLKMISIGTTLFETLNLDVAFSDSTVEVDGSELPVSFMINIGFEVTF